MHKMEALWCDMVRANTGFAPTTCDEKVREARGVIAAL